LVRRGITVIDAGRSIQHRVTKNMKKKTKAKKGKEKKDEKR